ncbi:MAG: 16S rRNA (guanine(966)-N(2))-methyltransferase RsmD [Moraxella sp.]|nr:16S rRNA (guanine(966)-N(2))-methyltransferase RsmD [Moraxella sp.]
MPKQPTKAPQKKAEKPTQKNQVRIIAGSLKRRSLPLVNAEGIRPTPDRVRETVFNWLMGDLQGTRVLDVCAGSGAFGIECISRGAKEAILIEPFSAQAALLKDSLEKFGISHQVTLYQKPAQSVLPTLTGVFDVVFIDPPYALNLWETLMDALSPKLHENSLIYLEGDKPLEALLATPENFLVIKSGKFGQIYGYLLRPHTA